SIWAFYCILILTSTTGYLYIWLLQDKERISQNTNGSTMVHVTKRMIEERVFDFPPAG
ncbi:hypothetical protein SMU57_05069, partial [Streptococcus mutans NMT4863]